MKKPRFTPRRYKESAQELLYARDKAQSFLVEVYRAYPLQSKPTRKAHAVLTAIDALRDELDDCRYREVREKRFLRLLLLEDRLPQ